MTQIKLTHMHNVIHH